MRSGRANLRAQRAKIRPERAKLRPRGGDGRTDGRTEGWTSRNSPLCPTGHWPFGAAAQKREEIEEKEYREGKEKVKKKNESTFMQKKRIEIFFPVMLLSTHPIPAKNYEI